jgi:tight adherence protein C
MTTTARVAVVFLAWRWVASRRSRETRRNGRRRNREARSSGDVVLLADLVVLGLSAGLSAPTAISEAADEMPADLRREVRTVLRTLVPSGAAAGMSIATGRGERIYRLVARSAASGAPLLGSLRALADELRREAHEAELTAARRLPVRLLFPLSLLILPGFVILIVGPALLGAATRLGL